MQPDAVHSGPILRYRVDPPLLGPPVVGIAPVLDQLGDAVEGLVRLVGLFARIAVGDALAGRAAGPGEPGGQVIEDLIGHGDPEWRRSGHKITWYRPKTFSAAVSDPAIAVRGM